MREGWPVASVVIPAHDEERSIARCLDALLPQLAAGDEVVVACNGCTDRTAAIARAYGRVVTVIELPTPSKVDALNAADRVVTSFPRLYLDADVVLDAGVVRGLFAAVHEGAVDLAAPRVRYDLSRSSIVVRAYYRIWTRLPSVRDDTVGRGAFAMSRRGRDAFEAFPDVLGDDHYAREQVPPERRGVVAEGYATVMPPRSVRALVRRRARTVEGNRQVAELGPVERAAARARRREWIGVVRRRPRLVPVVPLYVALSLLPRVVAAWRRWSGHSVGWGRDDSRSTSPR